MDFYKFNIQLKPHETALELFASDWETAKQSEAYKKLIADTSPQQLRIKFNEDEPYTVTDNGGREVEYAEKQEIIDGIVEKYHSDWLTQAESPENADSADGQNQAESQNYESQRTPPKKQSGKKNGGNGMKPVPPSRRQSPPSRLNQEANANEPT